MKLRQHILLYSLLLLLVAAVSALVLTSSWVSTSPKSSATGSSSTGVPVVDQRPLQTAQRLAPLAVTPDEQDLAGDALRLGDHEVDLAFDFAFRDAAAHPAPLSPATKEIQKRIQTLQASAAADQADVTRLTPLVAKATEAKKDAVQEELNLAQAQLSLDQDALNDAHQDLIDAGADPRGKIQQALDEHEQSTGHKGGATVGSGSSSNEAAIEETTAQNVLAQFRAWFSLVAKQKQLDAARQEILAAAADLAHSHDALQKEVEQKKHAPKQSLPLQSPATSSPAASPTQAASSTDALSRVHELAEDQKTLTSLGKRVEDERALARTYANWSALVQAREHFFLHGLLQSLFWILMILFLALIAGLFSDRFFNRLGPERKRLLTLRSVIRVSINALAVILILLVLFGPPSQLATIIALAGAGLTVALKDFIVGFFGWFVLMGRNGIRPGDWVEINGVGGEVVEVGLLHTVLLETGNWSDSSHPTGRKVTFVNSFAIEGHYFNFSTSGQWMWDELEVQIPAGHDPFPIAEAVQKIAAKETESAARLAEKEWTRVAPSHASSTFKADPSMAIQPAGAGVSVRLRYITRANERHDLRARLYRAIIDLLHKKKLSESARVSAAAVSDAD
ncbi:MAG TPA: mechanosensitive ion channel domain-containing protein [Candidatus Acidoferrales bacterium]|nr:mechanosensitive ion channel domain-containing protein [Candidatus Acidoferrales bacterium]